MIVNDWIILNPEMKNQHPTQQSRWIWLLVIWTNVTWKGTISEGKACLPTSIFQGIWLVVVFTLPETNSKRLWKSSEVLLTSGFRCRWPRVEMWLWASLKSCLDCTKLFLPKVRHGKRENHKNYWNIYINDFGMVDILIDFIDYILCTIVSVLLALMIV